METELNLTKNFLFSVTFHEKEVHQMERRTTPTMQPPVANSTHTPAKTEDLEDYDSDDASKTVTHSAHD